MFDNDDMRDDSWRKAILDYVKPLAVGMDGATDFGDVERIVRAAEGMAAARPEIRRDALFLLAAFSGQGRWVLHAGHGSRTELFLFSVGCTTAQIRELFRALARYHVSPQTSEEEIVHDAWRLEETGAYGLVRLMTNAAREQMDFRELCGQIEHAIEIGFRTEEGKRLAAPRLGLMRTFAEALRGEYEMFAVLRPETPPAGTTRSKKGEP
jgi:hypothetical protein